MRSLFTAWFYIFQTILTYTVFLNLRFAILDSSTCYSDTENPHRLQLRDLSFQAPRLPPHLMGREPVREGEGTRSTVQSRRRQESQGRDGDTFREVVSYHLVLFRFNKTLRERGLFVHKEQ